MTPTDIIKINATSAARYKEHLYNSSIALIAASKRLRAYIGGQTGSGKLTARELSERMTDVYTELGEIESIVFGYSSLDFDYEVEMVSNHTRHDGLCPKRKVSLASLAVDKSKRDSKLRIVGEK